MSTIPAGVFTTGERRTQATIASYCLDQTEIAVGAYEGCVQAGACTAPNGYLVNDQSKNNRACNWSRPGAALHPVNCVDWNQAVSYCAWVQKRLPTEEEWEWAARSGERGWTYPWGNDEPNAARVNACGPECVTWSKRELGFDLRPMYAADDAWATTAPVGTFTGGANFFGVKDLAGNVAEWTSSAFDAAKRVHRGGSWFNGDASAVRAATRVGEDASGRHIHIGFRCARSIGGAPPSGAAAPPPPPPAPVNGWRLPSTGGTRDGAIAWLRDMNNGTQSTILLNEFTENIDKCVRENLDCEFAWGAGLTKERKWWLGQWRSGRFIVKESNAAEAAEDKLGELTRRVTTQKKGSAPNPRYRE
jgi:hypothetical protein